MMMAPQQKIIEYRLFSPAEVNDALKQGWHLWGFPYVGGSGYTYQAMVKYAPPPKGSEW